MQSVHEYDVVEYPFTELVCEALGVTPAELSKLHETVAGRHAQREPPRSGHDPFRRRWTTYISSEPAARRRLDAIVGRFVAVRVRAALGNRWVDWTPAPALSVALTVRAAAVYRAVP